MNLQIPLPLKDELIVDNFAGGGGASLGIEQAIGRPVDIAINHDREAISMHMANHINTDHHCEDVFEVDPIEATGGQPVGLAWFSPDCKHFSKAKGGRPVEKKIRGLAWVVVKWAAKVKPRVIILENVEEFQTWGPLNKDDKPCPKRKGLTFRRWIREIKKLGYQVDWKELRACDYGAPTIRKRLFVIARRDGLPIVWPKPTHGESLIPFRTAADCIDWSIPCPSIFTRKKPLAEATMNRIARGIQRFVIDNADPFIIRLGHTNWNGNGMQYKTSEPLTTITSKAEHCLVTAFIVKHFGGMTGVPVSTPFPTITAKGTQNQIITSNLIKLRNNQFGQDVRTPFPTLTSGGLHVGEVRAFLVKYYGTAIGHSLNEPIHTITSKHRYGLVTIKGEDYQIVDIGMRMLSPRELYRAQGFPDSYIIDPMVNGKPLTKTAQVRMCGNSVSPPNAAAIVSANFQHELQIAV